MRSAFVVLAVSALALAACKSTTTPSPAPTSSKVVKPSPPSQSPAVRKVGDCQIEPGSDCRADDLAGAHLHRADLHGANLSLADVKNANLSVANLRKVDFKRANLAGADLRYAHLNGANLTDANLANADLTYASLKGATVTNASFTGATLCGTIRTDGTIDNTGCPKSPTPSPSPSPSGGLAITKFDVPTKADCLKQGKPTVPLSLSYATTGAKKVEIQAEKQTVASGLPPSGSTRIRIPCDANRIVVVMIASKGADRVSQKAAVKTGIT